MSALASSRGWRFDYPRIEGIEADLVLVTHEHFDHNGVEAIDGDPAVLRSTAGRLESPIGEVVASRPSMIRPRGRRGARTRSSRSTSTGFGRGTSAISASASCARSRPKRSAPSTSYSCPSAGGPTIGAEQAAAICQRLGPRWVVPMHYRTPRIGFLESADEFVARMPFVQRLDSPRFETAELTSDRTSLAVVPAAP